MNSFADLLTTWSWRPLPVAAALALAGLYAWCWFALRRRGMALAGPGRLAAMMGGSALVLAAMVSPVYALSEQLLLARETQKVLLCMLAPPLFWLAAPVPVILYGLPYRLRQAPFVRRMRRPRVGRAVRAVTMPVVAFFAFVAVFAIWHDPAFANWSLGGERAHRASLWLLLVVALYYWWHVVGAGRGRRVSRGGALAYLVGLEIPNLLAGVTIAFAHTPIYSHYTTVAQLSDVRQALPLSVLEDQMIAGALGWVFGSLVLIGAMVAVLNRFFAQHGASQPEPWPNWDADERMIAPGLEHRAGEQHLPSD